MPNVVISGSFRKNLDGIMTKVGEFEKAGVVVLSPKFSAPIDPKAEFVVLKTDAVADPKTLEQNHLAAIIRADALYVYNPSGDLGPSATLEMGFALAQGKPVFAKEVPSDFTLRMFCKQASVGEIKEALIAMVRAI